MYIFEKGTMMFKIFIISCKYYDNDTNTNITNNTTRRIRGLTGSSVGHRHLLSEFKSPRDYIEGCFIVHFAQCTLDFDWPIGIQKEP